MCSGEEPPGVWGIGTVAWWMWELGKPSPAPGLRMSVREAMGAYKR